MLLCVFMAQTAHAYHFLLDDPPRGYRPNTVIEYYINLGEWDTADNRAELITGIRNAFAQVDDHPHLNLTFLFMGTTTEEPQLDDRTVVHLASSLGPFGTVTNWSRDSDLYTIAADILIRGSAYVDDPLGNLTYITLHEMLHLLGLDHSSTGKDSAVFASNVRPTLSADDIAGLAVLYPNVANPLSLVTTTISGRVADASGSPVPCRVVAYQSGIEFPRTISVDTNANGDFALTGLPPGDYLLLAESTERAFLNRFFYEGETVTALPGTELTAQLTIENFGAPRVAEGVFEDAVYSAISNRLFVSQGHDKPVLVIDGDSHEVIGELNANADALAMSPDGERIYSVSQVTGKLSAFDQGFLSPWDITIGERPFGVAVSEEGLIYTVNDTSVSVVDPDTQSLVAEIPTPRSLWSITISADKRAYVAMYGGRILEIDVDPASPTMHTIVREFQFARGVNYQFTKPPSGDVIYRATDSVLEVLRESDLSLVHLVSSGGKLVFRGALSSDGSLFAFVRSDHPALRNAELVVVETTNHTIATVVPLGGDLRYVNRGSTSSEFLVGGDSGLVRVDIDPDSDGLFLGSDPDEDGDGVPNEQDAFPHDPRAHQDSDGDGIGDGIDLFPNDASRGLDSDGDLVTDESDAFPLDRYEWRDTDQDGVGDNLDRFPDDPANYFDADGDGDGDNHSASIALDTTQAFVHDAGRGIFITAQGGTLLFRDDRTTSHVASTETLGTNTGGLLLAPNQEFLYVFDPYVDGIQVVDINPTSPTYLDVWFALNDPALTSCTDGVVTDSNVLYVDCSKVVVIDMAAAEVIEVIDTRVRAIALSEDQLSLYLARVHLEKVDIDPNSATYHEVQQAANFAGIIHSLALSSTSSRLFLGLSDHLSVRTTDGLSEQRRITIGTNPHYRNAVSKDGRYLATRTRTAAGHHQFLLLDTQTLEIVERVPLPAEPKHIYATADGRFFAAGDQSYVIAPFLLNPDDDGDGVADEADEFPQDASEQLDIDRDGIGDNADLWPGDTDNDGVSNDEDDDDDGDGLPDWYEIASGTTLLRADSLRDADGDGITNVAEFWAGSDAGDETSRPPELTSPDLVAAVLPASRSAWLGRTITGFATVINLSSTDAIGCSVSPETPLPAQFGFYATDSTSNLPIGDRNKARDIPGSAAQSFLFVLEFEDFVPDTVVRMRFDCANLSAAASITGVNTFRVSASVRPVPDMVALAQTPSGDGIVDIRDQVAAFSVASINLGSAGKLTARASVTNPHITAATTLCATDPTTGSCETPGIPSQSATLNVAADATPTFSVFISTSDVVEFQPDSNRILVEFFDEFGVVRGATSVALRTR